MSSTAGHDERELFDGAPYAYSSTAGPTDSLVLLAGACPIGPDGRVVAPGDLAAQGALAVANLAAALARVGSGLADVLRTTVYVATSDHAELVRGWEAVRSAFGDLDPPSTLVGVTVLGYPGQLVEVEAVARVGGDGAVSPDGGEV